MLSLATNKSIQPSYAPCYPDLSFPGESVHRTWCFVYGIICIAALLFVWRGVPETKGRTLEDIEMWWMKAPDAKRL
jgi:hypothetical protein